MILGINRMTSMNFIKKWCLHRRWLRRYRLAWKLAIIKEDEHPDFYEHDIEYWVQQELKVLKQKTL